ncbi:hypothetical protein [Providencia huaxiensis]|uniref:hypothetical protein n=1 Tax=Providencia huaxiensis TaxID=2027290 RepID=UPI001EFE7ADA|nr:hypothetical protein [Providencia huaxiensis]MCG9536394.1 hypothetical protein [Providencia huaxiensis]
MEEDDDNSDEELAPMVDGLSGTLCIIILVSMVFIFSGMKAAETHINYGQLNFEKIKMDIPNKRLFFKGGIHLSNNEISLIKKEIIKNESNKIIISGYINDKVSHSREKNTYNLLYMASLIKNMGINKEIVLKQGTSEHCPGWNSCIYWGYK